MAKIAPEKITVQLVARPVYAGSGPRGVDVYARKLYEELVRKYPRDTYFLSPSEHASALSHYTFFDPFFLTLPRKKPGIRRVVTVHDLIPLKFPKQFPRGIRGEIKWQLQKYLLRGVDAIITDSHCSARDIHELVGYPSDQIHVIPLAAPHTIATAELTRTIQVEYDLPSRYILYVGDINWSKNIPGLIRAYAAIHDRNTHLVFVGKAFVSGVGTKEWQDISEEMKRSGKSEYIHLLGFVPSHHLAAIYRQATLYVQPSWYEGFGFPLLEAMVQGCPILSSNGGSLSEVGGEHVHYFDPNIAGQFEQILQGLLSNAAARERYVTGAKTWVKHFNWGQVARTTRQIYATILS